MSTPDGSHHKLRNCVYICYAEKTVDLSISGQVVFSCAPIIIYTIYFHLRHIVPTASEKDNMVITSH